MTQFREVRARAPHDPVAPAGDERAGHLTHLDTAGHARMVDVSAKPVTQRAAVAVGRVLCAPETVEALRRGELAKGDALAVARIAGIAGAKRTPDLVPLCHPVAITGVEVSVELVADGVEIRAQVRTAERTGIEMEALTAVTVAALTVVDMVKAVDRAAHIGRVWVERKEGGASGTWERGKQVAADEAQTPGTGTGTGTGTGVSASASAGREVQGPRAEVQAVVVTVSDRCSAGERDDVSGPVLAEILTGWGAQVSRAVVADDAEAIAEAVRDAVDCGARLVLTTGGTGVTSRDVTPETVRPLLDKELPALAQAVRDAGRGTPGALLSRCVAGIVGRSLVVTLPGSPGGVRDGARVLAEVVEHLLDQLGDGDHPSARSTR
ncbi:bifunctional molybdenum cofactor biosynthesis protein MoaC/MoaB [Sanguibacter sp. 4.1]|uniref:Cyclic pyranopterin monophosphate synthase n=1 Tax=Sanguibacter biliveldensis TaxID=3030830 RepID=A0AAF1C4L2_9MICO|nr:bifunctional molybdenum cofactor biosynthesis protein MoaC/MoaB [Sanguibacter sp. 4.1]WPF82728.1 bifunctional molybdenum cofactor biosynthesis protein MoaC/MoaB [Sanguibacter sp. 4.1]